MTKTNKDEVVSARFVSKQGHVLKAKKIDDEHIEKYSGPWQGQPAEKTVLNCSIERFIEEYDKPGSYYIFVSKGIRMQNPPANLFGVNLK